jgi:tetratricopeptide (TPR) repeat protein
MTLGHAVAWLVIATSPGAGAPPVAPTWKASLALSGKLRLSADWDAARMLVETALRDLRPPDEVNGRLRLLVELSAIEREVNGYRKKSGWSAALTHLAGAEALLDGAVQESHAAVAEERAWLGYSRAFDGEVGFADVRRSFEEARVLREQAGDEAGLARSWFGIGLTHQHDGQLAEARAAFERGLDLAERSRSIVTQGYLQRHLGFVMADLQKNPAVAVPYYERSLALRRRGRHRWGEVFAMITLGRALTETGNAARARSLLRRAAAAGAKLQLTRGMAEAEEALADLERSSKAGTAACRHLDEAARLWRSFGDASRAVIEAQRKEWNCPENPAADSQKTTARSMAMAVPADFTCRSARTRKRTVWVPAVRPVTCQ